MLIKTLFIGVACLLVFQEAKADASGKVICYYNGQSAVKEGLGKMLPADIEPALAHCTHLVYGFATINPDTYKIASSNERLDLDSGSGNYRLVTGLKRKFPSLKVLLSLGADHDPQNKDKYLPLLESAAYRTGFVNSAYDLIHTYEFDGLDLAWDFPLIKPKKIRSTVGSLFHGFKKRIGVTGSPVDEDSEIHKEQFTSLVRELRNAFRHDGYILSTTVNPNVNSTLYFDIRNIINNLDFVQLGAYDFVTPERNPKQADYTTPIYTLPERDVEHNIDAVVSYWTKGGAPASKLILGIPTYGRVWKMTEDSAPSGLPPIEVDGAGPEGPQSKTPGLYSYPETCARLVPNALKGAEASLTKITDTSRKYGTYAFHHPDEKGLHGIWISYEDPDSAGHKANYVRTKGLGGISINGLALDDFKGLCSGDKFPILKAAKSHL